MNRKYFKTQKVETKDLKNGQPMAFSSVIAKLTTTHFPDTIDSHQPIEQARFRSGFSVNHIHIMKLLCMSFVDYEKSLDSVQITY